MPLKLNKAVALLLFRLLLAIGGGFCLSIFITAALPGWLAALWGADKASVFVWMMLLSFIIYTVVIIWVISSRHLARTSLILLLLCTGFYLGIEVFQPQVADTVIEAQA